MADYERWRGAVPTEIPVDPENPEEVMAFLKDAMRELDGHLRDNNPVMAYTVGIAARFRGLYELAYGVAKGYLVYFNGEQMALASLTDIAKRPRAVVDSIEGESGGIKRAYCWYASGEVEIATSETSVAAGAELYLSATDGVCAATAPEIDGGSVVYTGVVGWATGDVLNGKVRAVFSPILAPWVG